jgi:alpha-L-fucosidase 2
MKYEARAKASSGATTTCSNDGTLTITPSKGSKSLTIVFSADTNYDQKMGNAQHNYSFKGKDAGPGVEDAATKASKTAYRDLLAKHVSDYSSLFSAFTLQLPDPNGSIDKDTASAISQYSVDGQGDPFVEGLLFDYSRYMLITSSRDNSLPANLQGRWAEQLSNAWSADYHANINIQMNYWAADQTGLAKTQPALWNYMQDTWVPRGTETAKLLYDAPGWVTHSEMNIFGHTAMKNDATWANCR